MKTLITLLLLSSCAAMEKAHQDWLAANCNKEAAYSLGTEDAQNKDEHDTSRFNACPNKQEIGKIKMGYSKGYNAANNNPLSVIKDIVGATNYYYRCTVDAFGTEFKGSSKNKGKAKAIAINKCTKEHDSMHCDDIECIKL